MALAMSTKRLNPRRVVASAWAHHVAKISGSVSRGEGGPFRKDFRDVASDVFAKRVIYFASKGHHHAFLGLRASPEMRSNKCMVSVKALDV